MPAPLWPSAGGSAQSESRRQFRSPAILRFANDSFMDEFLDLLASDPGRLREFVATPETWSSPPNEPAPPVRKSGLSLQLQRARNAAVRRLEARGQKVIGATLGTPPKKTLKLFQPVHQRFYLVSACLVCRMLGLPDRRLDAGVQERATFVLRMLQPRPGADPHNPDPRACDELALVSGAWQRITDSATLVPGEDQRPLSPAQYVEFDQRSRRLFIGLIPVAERDNLLKGAQPNPASEPPLRPLTDARNMLLKKQVIYPLSTLEALAIDAVKMASPDPTKVDPMPSVDDLQKVIDGANARIQTVSYYVLLDLARYLETYVRSLWNTIHDGSSATSLTPQAQTLLGVLTGSSSASMSLRNALKKAYDAADVLETVRTAYTPGSSAWPNFTFQFYTAAFGGAQGLTAPLARDAFETQIMDAVKAEPGAPPATPPVDTVSQASSNPQVPVWFAIRCVFERPNCGPLAKPLVSEPSVAFQLSAFFDPDAPARPIRIGLPIDTTPAGLRKFDKNTAFVMSDTLCGQVGKMGGMSFADLVLSVLPFPFHQGLDSGGGKPCSDNGTPWGMVCSLSIPIITICAFILLIIFIKLFDIVFFWMPFFQICLPLPKLSSKDS